MAYKAKVTDILTTDFAEIELIDEGSEYEPRYVAEFKESDMKVKIGDIVEMEKADNRIMNQSRIAYVAVPIFAIIAFLVTKDLGTAERILAAALTFLMAFIIAWIMNRRSRMLKYRAFRITKILKKGPNHFLDN
ncbi:MAG: SoxR reducing system RseC family protein [Firmicutes bacterium]|nr:SoxR reducing system RseC family protein [Bacillota bacterium]